MRWLGSAIAAPATVLAVFLGFGDASVEQHEVYASDGNKETRGLAAEPNMLFSASGVTEPRSKCLKILSEVPGTIQAIHVAAGDQIVKGQVLVELQNDMQRTGVELARAALDRAEAEQRRLMSGERPEERAIARAQYDEAEAALRDAETQLERVVKMASDSIASARELTGTQNAHAQAQARCDAARKRWDLAEAGPRDEDLVRADAVVREAKAQTDVAELLLEKTQIRSPIDGIVVYRYLEPGEVVHPDSPAPILTIGDRATLHIRVDVDELDIAQARVGQRVVATAPAFGNQRFQGHVVHIEPTLGRKNFRTNRPTEQIDSKVQEVVVALDHAAEVPLELQMVVWFLDEYE